MLGQESKGMLQSLSERLLGLTAPSLPSGIEGCLEDLGVLARAERVYVFLLSEDGQALARAFEWCAQGVIGHDFETFKGVPVTAFPWSMERFLRDEVVYVDDAKVLPTEAEAERAACDSLGIGAYVNLPLFIETRLVGWLGFDSAHPSPGWSKEDLAVMRAAGRMMVFTLDRIDREAKLLSEQALSRRLAALGSFAAGLGHELNNPLSYVELNMDFLQQTLGAEVDPAVRSSIDDCLQGVRRMSETISRLRAFARRTSPDRAVVDVESELDTAVEILGPQIALRAQLFREGQARVEVMAAPSELGQVLTNIIQNALDALPEGRKAENFIRIQSQVDADSVQVRISDSGPGFSDESLPHVFDPFFTTRGDAGGSGIGLALCHSIVQQLGGTISASNDPAGGAAVVVRLPRAHRAEDVEPAQEPTSLQRRRILVVDDEAALHRIMARILAAHEVVEAHGGDEAIDLLAADPDFDLVICDIRMPEGTGREVYDYVARERPALATRFVFVSGGSDDGGRGRSALADVPLLAKPFGAEDLLREVSKHAPLRDRPER